MHIYTIFTKGVLGKPSNLGGGEGGQKKFIASFHVLGHCSYEYDFLMIFLFFPEKVQESKGVNTVNKKSFELGLSCI